MQDSIVLNKQLQSSILEVESRRKRLLERALVLKKMGEVCDATRVHLSLPYHERAKGSANELSHQAGLISLSLASDGQAIKVCGCGREYKPSEWFDLPLLGYQDTLIIGGEMRNCGCQSTLLVITKRR